MIYTNTNLGFGFKAEQIDLGLLIPSVTVIGNDKTQKITISPKIELASETDKRFVKTFLGKGFKNSFKTESEGHIFRWYATETDKGIIFGASYTNKTDKTVYLHSFNLSSSSDKNIKLNGDPSDWILDANASVTDKPISTYDLLTERYNAWRIPLDLPKTEKNSDSRWRSFNNEYGTVYSKSHIDGLYIAPVGEPIAAISTECFVDVDEKGQGFCILEENVDMSNIVIKPGQTRDSQEIFFGYGPWEELSTLVFTHLAQTHGNRTHKKVPVGWCSWYDLAMNITQESILSTIEGAKKLLPILPLDVIQMDDGYQRERGDWECITDENKFPDGFEIMLNKIKETGAMAGIWLAPTNIKGNTKMFEEYYDCMWNNQDGKLRERDPKWKENIHKPDITNPIAMKAVANILRKKRELGYNYFKIDFNQFEVDGTVSYDGTKTKLQTYRELYKNYREAIGEDAYLCACSGMTRGVFGFADSCRTGTDSCDVWMREHYFSCDIANSIWDTHNIQMANGIIFAVDPDVTYVNTREITKEELRVWSSFVGLLGGTQMVSDALDKDITQQNIRMFEILAPASIDKGIPVRGEVDHWKRRFGFNSFRTWGNAGVYSVFNPEETSATVNTELIKLDELGDKFHVYSFWDNEYMGIYGSNFPLELNAHACKLMRFTPIGEGVQFIGSDLHISTGSTEVLDFIATSTEATIELRADAGARNGSICLYSETEPKEIAFEGIAEASYTYENNIIMVSLKDRSRSGKQFVTVKF